MNVVEEATEGMVSSRMGNGLAGKGARIGNAKQ